MALADQVWAPFAISAVVLAFSGAAGSQLFAAVHDDLQTTATPWPTGSSPSYGWVLTAGWVVGPVLGSILATAAGSRVMLAATGFCALAQIVPMGFARTGSAQPGAHTAPASEVQAGRIAHRPKLRKMLPLLVFTGLYVFVYAGEPIKYGYLPIYMRDDLRMLTTVSGAVIGIQPLIELILMPVAVVVARRIGMMHLMILGAACGVGANLCFALTGDAAECSPGRSSWAGCGVCSQPWASSSPNDCCPKPSRPPQPSS